LIGEILRRAGLVDYHAGNAFEAEIEKHGLSHIFSRRRAPSERASRMSQPQTLSLAMIDAPGLYSGTLAMWEQHLKDVQNLPHEDPNREWLIEQAESEIASRRRESAGS